MYQSTKLVYPPCTCCCRNVTKLPLFELFCFRRMNTPMRKFQTSGFYLKLRLQLSSAAGYTSAHQQRFPRSLIKSHQSMSPHLGSRIISLQGVVFALFSLLSLGYVGVLDFSKHAWQLYSVAGAPVTHDCHK